MSALPVYVVVHMRKPNPSGYAICNKQCRMSLTVRAVKTAVPKARISHQLPVMLFIV